MSIYTRISKASSVAELRDLYQSFIPRVKTWRGQISSLQSRIDSDTESIKTLTSRLEQAGDIPHVKRAFYNRLGELSKLQIEE